MDYGRGEGYAFRATETKRLDTRWKLKRLPPPVYSELIGLTEITQTMKVTLFGVTIQLLRTNGESCAKLKSPQKTDPCSLASHKLVMSTPLTDDEIKQVLQTGQHEKVKAEFARKLERQLNEERAKQSMAVADGCACRCSGGG